MGFDIKSNQPTEAVAQQAATLTKTEDIKTTSTPADSYKYNPQYHAMADLLGLQDEDRLDLEIAQKISFLRDFTSEKEEVDAKIKLKQMIKDLGLSSRGRDLVKNLYQFARLSQEKTRIEKELSLIVENKHEQPQGEHPTVNRSGGA